MRFMLIAVFISFSFSTAHSGDCQPLQSNRETVALTAQFMKKLSGAALPLVFRQCFSVLARNKKNELLIEVTPAGSEALYYIALPVKKSQKAKDSMVEMFIREIELQSLVHQYVLSNDEMPSYPLLDPELIELYSGTSADKAKLKATFVPLKDGTSYYATASQIPYLDISRRQLSRMIKAFRVY